MAAPIETLAIKVEHFDGQDTDDVGHPYYVASCDAIGLVTDGETLNDLMRNLREALELVFEDDMIETYNVIPEPRIQIVMELAHYAEIA